MEGTLQVHAAKPKSDGGKHGENMAGNMAIQRMGKYIVHHFMIFGVLCNGAEFVLFCLFICSQ